MPLAVRDEVEREAVREAAAALWPKGPLQVVEALEGDGLVLEGGVLVWRRQGAVVREAPGVDPTTAVVLARSWLASDGGLGGQVPEIPFAVEDLEPRLPEPKLKAKPAAPPAPPHLWVGLGADASLGGTASHGLRSSAGWVSPGLELDLAFTFSLPGSSLVTEADLRREVERVVARAAGVGLSVVWDLGLERGVPGKVTLTPLLEAGAELGPTRERVLTWTEPAASPQLALEPLRLGASVTGAVGLDLWAGPHAGVRAALRLRPDALDIDMWGSISLMLAGRSKDPPTP
jgi:hypothetical protein